MTTTEEVTKQVSKIQTAIGNKYKNLAEEYPEAAHYLCNKMERLLLSNGFLTKIDLRGDLK